MHPTFDDLDNARDNRTSAFQIVEYDLNAARVELDAFDSAVTDWERPRGFERL